MKELKTKIIKESLGGFYQTAFSTECNQVSGKKKEI